MTMMVSDINKLAELVELDSVPAWIREAIDAKKDEILEKLQTEGFFEIHGPDGSKVTLRPKARELVKYPLEICGEEEMRTMAPIMLDSLKPGETLVFSVGDGKTTVTLRKPS